MKVWVTRDKTKGGDVAVWVGNESDLFINQSNNRWGCEIDSDTYEIDRLYLEPKQFKRDFDFAPRKGSVKQMDLSLTEID